MAAAVARSNDSKMRPVPSLNISESKEHEERQVSMEFALSHASLSVVPSIERGQIDAPFCSKYFTKKGRHIPCAAHNFQKRY